jgi:hypothetical protein
MDLPVTCRMQQHAIAKGVRPSELNVQNVMVVHVVVIDLHFVLTVRAKSTLREPQLGALGVPDGVSHPLHP